MTIKEKQFSGVEHLYNSISEIVYKVKPAYYVSFGDFKRLYSKAGNALTDREIKINMMYYWDKISTSEIAKQENISATRVVQILNIARWKLAKQINDLKELEVLHNE